MLVRCWAGVANAGPTSYRHRVYRRYSPSGPTRQVQGTQLSTVRHCSVCALHGLVVDLRQLVYQLAQNVRRLLHDDKVPVVPVDVRRHAGQHHLTQLLGLFRRRLVEAGHPAEYPVVQLLLQPVQSVGDVVVPHVLLLVLVGTHDVQVRQADVQVVLTEQLLVRHLSKLQTERHTQSAIAYWWYREGYPSCSAKANSSNCLLSK